MFSFFFFTMRASGQLKEARISSHLFDSVAKRGSVGRCHVCSKHFGPFAKVASCRMCSVVSHKTCIVRAPPDCAGGCGTHLSDEVSFMQRERISLDSSECVRGAITVDGKRHWGVLGGDRLFFFASEKVDSKAPDFTWSLVGATLTKEPADDKMKFSNSCGASIVLSEFSWAAELGVAIKKATDLFFAVESWNAAKLVPGLVLEDIDEPLLDRVLLRNAAGIARSCDVIDADDLEAPFIIRLQSASAGNSAVVTVTLLSGGVSVDPVVSYPNNQWLLIHPRINNLNASTMLLFTVSDGTGWAVVVVVPKVSFFFSSSLGVEHVHTTLCDEGGRIRLGEHRLPLWPGEGCKFQFDVGMPPIDVRSGREIVVFFGPPNPVAAPVVFRSCRQIELFSAPFSDLAWDDPVWSVLEIAKKHDEETKSIRTSHRGISSTTHQHGDVFCPIETLSPDQMLYLWETRDASDATSTARALSAVDLSSPKQRRELVEFLGQIEASGTHLFRFSAFQLLLHSSTSALLRHFAARSMFAWKTELGHVSLPGVSVLSFASHDANPAAVAYLRALCS